MKVFMLSVGLLLCTTISHAQDSLDTGLASPDTSHLSAAVLYPAALEARDRSSLNVSSVLVPAAGITYGILALHQGSFNTLNKSTRYELQEDHPHFHTHVDDFLQYSPAAAMAGLNIAGVRGAHDVKDEICLYGISSFIMFASVEFGKHFSHEQRPDHSDYSSFPSGHTANVFAGAEMLRMEYGQRSPWIAIAGYAAAAGTGTLRVYNNRHWVSDVVAGAAVGFLSTRVAYAVNPWVERHILHRQEEPGPPVSLTRLEWHDSSAQKASGPVNAH